VADDQGTHMVNEIVLEKPLCFWPREPLGSGHRRNSTSDDVRCRFWRNACERERRVPLKEEGFSPFSEPHAS